MALNIFPRRRDAEQAPAASEPTNDLPEPSPEVLDDLAARPRTRSRGGRGRGRGAAATADQATGTEDGEANSAPASDETGEPASPAPRRRPSRSRAALAEAAAAAEALAAGSPAEPPAEAAEPTVASSPSDETTTAEPAEALDAPARGDRPRGSRGERGREPREPREPRGEPREPRDQQPREPREPREQQPRTPRGEGDIPSLLRAIEQQQRQIEQLIRMQEEGGRRGGNAGPGAAVVTGAPPARVGIFVDSANIELACDRLRVRFDWGRVLRMFTEGRQLVRALAYSPVHDDPNVSIETQRFVEPFLDKGYKVVTKPLRRFQDGTIKANVDIELALDVISMLDRLDIVVLASGDGDFQSLVELVQSKGVRVEVAAVGSSTATNLKHAADVFIDLASRARDLRA